MRNSVKAACAAFAMAIALAGSAISGPFEDSVVAADRGDYATALRLLRPLADEGVAEAQYNLGLMYERGEGVPQDYREAVKWYLRAAEQGDAIAQSVLGLIYREGRGVPQDYSEALKWSQLAAEQGDDAGMANLGSMYAQGNGVRKDFVEAHKWTNLAVALQPASKKDLRDKLVNLRNSLEKVMTPAQIAEAQKLAREWMATHPDK